MNKNNLYSIDISGCEKISDLKSIQKILKSALEENLELQLKPIKGKKQYSAIARIKKLEPGVLVLTNIRFQQLFSMNEGIELEVLLEAGTVAHFFVSEVKPNSVDRESTIRLSKPVSLYKIIRRDYFRLIPIAENPIAISFIHANITYEYYIHDISAGGFSIRIPYRKTCPFQPGELLQGIKIHFLSQQLTIRQAVVVRINREASHLDDQPRIVGFKFLELTEVTRDELIKNIFLEHRKILAVLQNRYANI